jgi:hypothetical protein
MQKTVEDLTNLNSSVAIAAYPGLTFCADGSNSLGARPGTPSEADSSGNKPYYKDYVNRMFCVSKGPLKNTKPLYADGTARYASVDNLDTLRMSDSVVVEGATGVGGSIKHGLMRTVIPLTVQPVGESVPRRPTNREIPSILLVDF